MKSNKVMVDMDEVVADLFHAWAEVYNTKYALPRGHDVISRHQLTEWNITRAMPAATSKEVFGILDMPGLFLNLRPIPNAILGLKTLLNIGFEILLCTSCASRTAFSEKVAWIRRMIPELAGNVVGVASSETKPILFDGIAAAMVDDNPVSLGTKLTETRKVLFRAPHNTSFIAHRLYPLSNIKENLGDSDKRHLLLPESIPVSYMDDIKTKKISTLLKAFPVYWVAEDWADVISIVSPIVAKLQMGSDNECQIRK